MRDPMQRADRRPTSSPLAPTKGTSHDFGVGGSVFLGSFRLWLTAAAGHAPHSRLEPVIGFRDEERTLPESKLHRVELGFMVTSEQVV